MPPLLTMRPWARTWTKSGCDVVEQSLVVGDQQDAQVRVEHRVDALGDDPQRIDVEARSRSRRGSPSPAPGRPSGASRGASSRRRRSPRSRSGVAKPSSMRRSAIFSRILLRKSRMEMPPLTGSVGSMSAFLSMPWSLALRALADEARDAQAGDRGRVLEGEEHAEARRACPATARGCRGPSRGPRRP